MERMHKLLTAVLYASEDYEEDAGTDYTDRFLREKFTANELTELGGIAGLLSERAWTLVREEHELLRSIS